MRTASSPKHAKSLLLSSTTPLRTTLFCRVSLSPLVPDARRLLFTALTAQAVVSTNFHIACIVTNLWSRGISSGDSFLDSLLEPVTGAFKNVVSCCKTSHQNPHLSCSHSMQLPQFKDTFSRPDQPKNYVRLSLLLWSLETAFSALDCTVFL